MVLLLILLLQVVAGAGAAASPGADGGTSGPAVAAAAAGSSSSTDSPTAPGSLLSYAPVELSGLGEAIANQGGLKAVGPTSVSTAGLWAQSAVVEVTWETGVRAGPPEASTATRTDQGEDQLTFEDVSFTFTADTASAEVLAFDQPANQLLAELLVDTEARAVQVTDRMVAYAGPSGDTEYAGEPTAPGFVHELDGPAVWLETGDGFGRVQGNFSLFVNNLTLEATEARDAGEPREARVARGEQGARGGGTWSNWTGYREAEPAAPASTYERRQVLVHLENATFTVGPGVPAALFDEQLRVRLEGALASEDASGYLQGVDRALFYEREAVELRGAFDVELVGEAKDGGEGRLRLLPSGTFQAVPADGRGQATVVAPGPGAGGGGSEDGGGLPAAVWVLGLLAAVAVGAAAQTGVTRGMDHLRSWRYKRAMERAREAMDARDWEAAATAHEQATKARPDATVAWAYWAISLLETNRFEACLEVVDEARGVPNMDAWDLLTLEAAAAWGARRLARAARVLDRMARRDPEITRSFVDDLDIDLDQLSPELAHRLGRVDHPGGLDGYV